MSSGSIQIDVVVDVLVTSRPAAGSVLPPSSVTWMQHVHRVDAVDVLRIGEDLAGSTAGCRRRSRCASPSSRRASVGAEEAARLVGGLDDGVDDVRLRRARSPGRCGPCPPSGRPLVSFSPGGAAVGRLVDAPTRARRRSASRRAGAAGRPRRRARRGCAGRATTSVTPVFSLIVSDRLPGLAAVGRLVQAAVAAGPPERALRRDVDDVRSRAGRSRSCAMCSDFLRPTFFQLLPPSSTCRRRRRSRRCAGCCSRRCRPRPRAGCSGR